MTTSKREPIAPVPTSACEHRWLIFYQVSGEQRGILCVNAYTREEAAAQAAEIHARKYRRQSGEWGFPGRSMTKRERDKITRSEPYEIPLGTDAAELIRGGL